MFRPITAALPVAPANAPACHGLATNLPDGQTDFRLAAAAYNNYQACYDREYLFQFSEMDPAIHVQAAAQAGPAPEAGPQPGGPPPKKESDVVDAEFEMVDEDKKK